MTRLPPDYVGDGACGVHCPWCRRDASDATVTLGDLGFAHSDDALRLAPRAWGDMADEGALRAFYPHCHRPFIVALQPKATVRTLAVRTLADARLIYGERPSTKGLRS